MVSCLETFPGIYPGCNCDDHTQYPPFCLLGCFSFFGANARLSSGSQFDKRKSTFMRSFLVFATSSVVISSGMLNLNSQCKMFHKVGPKIESCGIPLPHKHFLLSGEFPFAKDKEEKDLIILIKLSHISHLPNFSKNSCNSSGNSNLVYRC